MMELIQAAFLSVNLVFTLLLILMVLYWVTVILGVMDVELFNIDVPDSVDADVDGGGLDVDGSGILRSISHFFYIGEIPIMLILSIAILCMWAMVVMGNHFFNPVNSMLAAVPVYAGSFIASLFVCKVTAMPIKKIYDMFNKDCNAPRKVIGRLCTVITSTVSEKLGQVEVKTKGAPIILNVVSEGGHIFHKGDEALVVSQDKERGIYKIAEVNLEK